MIAFAGLARPGWQPRRPRSTRCCSLAEWLANIHRELDAAVAKAYGWSDYTPEMTDDEILRRLLALNLARSRNSAQ